MATLHRSTMAITFLTAGLLCLSVFNTSVAGIKCFQCNSKVDDGCGNLTKTDFTSIYYKECDNFTEYEGEDPFCRKTEVTIEKKEDVEHRVVRACGWKKHHIKCYTIEEARYVERICQCSVDGCNPATTMQAAPSVLFAATAITFTITLKIML